MSKDFARLCAALVVPKDFSPMVMAIAQTIGKSHQCQFFLEVGRCEPHVTLYAFECPAQNLSAVLSACEALARFGGVLVCNISGVVSGQGFISLEIKNSPDLQRFHESLVAALNPLREDIFRQEFLDSYHMDFPINKIQQAKQYGYPDALDLFEPHLTLSRLQSPEVAKGIAADIELVEKAFTATRFGIYEMGEHGTCRRLIRDWPLAKHG